ncbi:multisubunit sodium/proton antiporter, MrpE subunit [Austwickia chelonae]|uniref:Na(+)/H(+) antiporter subunit E n=1 Tax=Austwickia chelonae NBRC 105200 TaxID=1184607 RepID=K6VQ61_9MICO|nr:Na+/H+ antiporter subunit E [Austwickia chelonae]GAB78894.1 Na(+)/H(+) antiporter subunit E [Austwickia chelonae NBRC 105200]SEV86047.1 multisubunit sodium/proton antiporter, MrpE subunit [Austwickia chelonae]
MRNALRRRVQLGPLFLLALVWVLLWGRLTWATAIGGLLVGLVVVLAFPLPPLSLGLRFRPWPFLVLFLRFNVDLVVASLQVAWAAVNPWTRPDGRTVRVPLRCDDDLFVVITAEMTALVPGTIVIDALPERRELLLHVFHARDEADLDKVRARVLAQEDRVLRALAADHRDIRARPVPGSAAGGVSSPSVEPVKGPAGSTQEEM